MEKKDNNTEKKNCPEDINTESATTSSETQQNQSNNTVELPNSIGDLGNSSRIVNLQSLNSRVNEHHLIYPRHNLSSSSQAMSNDEMNAFKNSLPKVSNPFSLPQRRTRKEFLNRIKQRRRGNMSNPVSSSNHRPIMQNEPSVSIYSLWMKQRLMLRRLKRLQVIPEETTSQLNNQEDNNMSRNRILENIRIRQSQNKRRAQQQNYPIFVFQSETDVDRPPVSDTDEDFDEDIPEAVRQRRMINGDLFGWLLYHMQDDQNSSDSSSSDSE